MEITRHWRLKGQRYGLTGSVCTECGKPFFSPRPVCDECSDSDAGIYHFEQKRMRHVAPQVFQPAQR